MPKILVVDDCTEVLEVLNDFLSLRGYEVILARNGKIGLEKYRNERPELAIIDVEMPVMDGYQLSKEIKNDNPQFPILIITAMIKKYPKSYFSDVGVNNVLFKPISFDTLNAELDKIFT
ncbi:MAG: response regulator [Caldithrix sp.]|nr:response regulator [Caldithrix sp.]